jgi:hypothetical protein
MSGETFWSGVWFSHKKDLKMGCKTNTGNIDPLLTKHVYRCKEEFISKMSDASYLTF